MLNPPATVSLTTPEPARRADPEGVSARRQEPCPERVCRPHALLGTTRAVIRDVAVTVSEYGNGSFVAVTDCEGHIETWDVADRSSATLRDLAHIALSIQRHGVDGRKGAMPVYDSCGGGQ